MVLSFRRPETLPQAEVHVHERVSVSSHLLLQFMEGRPISPDAHRGVLHFGWSFLSTIELGTILRFIKDRWENHVGVLYLIHPEVVFGSTVRPPPRAMNPSNLGFQPLEDQFHVAGPTSPIGRASTEPAGNGRT